MNIHIGTKLKLKVSCLNNLEGSIGICYEVYNRDLYKVYSFIFPNGNYDGFSEKDLELFFDADYMKYETNVANYKFRNVIALSNDFKNGYWKNYFNE